MVGKFIRHSKKNAALTLLISIAVVERFGWAIKRGIEVQVGEAHNVALALASGKGFADPYFIGSGPTAHLMPTTPVLGAAIHAIVGVRSPAAEMILQCIAMLEIVGGYVLLSSLFKRTGASQAAVIGAFGFCCILPLFMGQESLDFRYWEGALAVVLCLSCLITIIELDQRAGPPTASDHVLLAFLLAMTFFVSPSVGVGVALASVMLAFRRWNWGIRLRTGVLSCMILAALLTPWIIRNDRILGRPIVLRSNAALELSIANNDDALGADPGIAFRNSMEAYHPMNEIGASRVRAVGELGYMDELSIHVKNWIYRHPSDFFMLCLRHIRQMVLPDSFQFEIGSGRFSSARAIIYSFLAIFGLLGIIAGIFAGRTGYRYIGIVIVSIILTYAPFQPMARYLYLIYGLLTFAAFDFIYQINSAIKRYLDSRRMRDSMTV